jgi:predicted nuclease of predicted toxin-antitoxin system
VNVLLDAQLPPGFKSLLTAAGHEARHIAEVALRDATDHEIWNYAVRENMAIMTKDEDFALWRTRFRC